MPTTKGKSVGPRVNIDWGTVSRKVKGKKTNVRAMSRVLKSTADLFGLKESKASAPKIANVKTAKGSRKVIQSASTKVGTTKMYASVDGKTWHQLPLPMGLSLAKAYAMFQKGKKAYAIKFKGGTAKVIGKIGKDTKSKAKTAKATK